MKYYKYNKKIYRRDDKGDLWVYLRILPKFHWGTYDGNWKLLAMYEITQFEHQLKRKRACEKTQAEAFIELL